MFIPREDLISGISLRRRLRKPRNIRGDRLYLQTEEREEREREKERARGKRGGRLEEREKYGREYGVLTRLNFTDFLERFLINENNA